MNKLTQFMSFFIALRYYKNRHEVQFIHLLSKVSVISISVCIAALIIILSVFNGFYGIIENLYKHFYTDLQIEASNNSYFQLSPEQKKGLESLKPITSFGKALRSKALLQTKNGQMSSKIYGIDSVYIQLIDLKDQLYQANAPIQLKKNNLILGQGIANSLGLDLSNNLVNIYFPRRNKNSLELEDNLSLGQFQMISQFITGQSDFDNQLTWLSLETLQNYLGLDSTNISQISLNIQDSKQIKEVIKALRVYFPEPNFRISDYYQQNSQLYSVINGEKTAIILILSFILFLASFNITGTLSLAILHKSQNLLLLFSIGMSIPKIKRIFLYLGLLLGIAGTFWGLIIGSLVLLTQYYWHWIPMHGGNFVIDYFPVRFNVMDFILVTGIGIGIAFITSIYAMYRVGHILTRSNSLRLK